ncbi:MAG: hypothetical protein WCH11_05635 [Bdellovibrio sp.]
MEKVFRRSLGFQGDVRPARIWVYLKICSLLGSGLLTIVSCQSRHVGSDSPDQELRIAQDRTHLLQLRGNIPPEKRLENDEKAFDLNLLSNSSRNPEEIRSVFDQEMRKKREKFQKAIDQERKLYSQNEKTQRQDFLKDIEKERRSFSRSRSSSQEKSEFQRAQNDRRRDFFAKEREDRADFESDLRARRKDFDDLMKARQSGFYQELRAFSQRAKDARKKNATTREELDQVLRNNPPQEVLTVE